ncbi:RTA1 domain-containing protein [Aspergillus lucknowensis]|uniref:RTA-like protein n=1 Tax=Aspergillus lucknowensis TaxID=176173 RepID=A0ABR4L5X5_9EURO
MVLGRLITFLGAERLSLVRVKWMTAIFVTGDVIAFLAQAAGGGIMAGGSVDDFERGEKITIGGLGVQLAFFGGFMITCASFHHRIRKSPTPEATSLASRVRGKRMRSWETILVGLYIASILILVRSIFRLVEYVQGNNGYLISHEVFMYVFDSSLMFITMVVMNICHPSMVLSGSQKERDVEIGSLASSVGQRS